MKKKTIDPAIKKEISRLRSEVRKLSKTKSSPKTKKDINAFTGMVSGNYWTQTGMPWVSSEGRKAVLTEYFWQPIRGQPRRVDTNELRQFSQTFWVSSCVKTLMDEVATLEWDIVPKDGWEYEWVKEEIQRVKSFLQQPNKNGEDFSALIRKWIKDILELDAGVIVKVFDIRSYDFNEIEPKSGAPMLKPIGQRNMTELYVMDGASFLKEIDKFGFLKGFWQYSYQIPAHPMWFDRDEIVYCSEQPRSMSCYGYARTQAILDIIQSLHYSTRYNKRFFEESPIPDGAISLLNSSEEEIKMFSDYWYREYAAQPHKLAIVNKDIKFQPFNITNRELEFLETQKWYYNMVISMFGLTPSELGITENVNKSTSATQAEVVKRKGVRPFLKLFETFINNGIIPEFQVYGVEFQFIYDDPAEKASRLNNWRTELEMGVKTPNEVRIEMGLEPLEGGDQLNTMASRLGMQMSPMAGGQPNSVEDFEAQGYKEGLEREEAKQDKRREEGSKEAQEDVKNPYSPKSRPVGNFKSLKKDKYKTMPLKDLIEEHKRLVEVLRRADKQELKEEYEEQKRELESYIEEAKKKVKKKAKIDGFVAPVGQYYNDQPIAHPRKPSGAHFQPQNPEPTPPRQVYTQRNPPVDTNPSQLGSSYARPGIDTFESPQQLNCPMCGKATLATIESETTMQEDIRCTFCGARFREQELAESKLLEEINNVLTANNSTKPVSIPSMKSKHLDKCDCQKCSESIEKSKYSEMTVKEYVGLDVDKSFPFSSNFADSREYKKMLMEYLKDLGAQKVNEIIKALRKGLNNGKNISDIAREINQIIDDAPRAELIARTEIVRLANQGNLMKMQQKGTKKVEFISSPEDGRLCPICKTKDGKIYDIKDAKGVIPVHVACRCVFTEYYGNL